MSHLSVRESYSSIWGCKCFTLRDNRKPGISLVIIERGGRIISLKADKPSGGRSIELAYSNPAIAKGLRQAIEKKRDKVSWDDILIGGHKTWVAPQKLYGDMVPFLDLNVGSYSVERLDQEDLGLKLTSPVCRESHLQIVSEVTLSASQPGAFRVSSFINNLSYGRVRMAPWQVFQLRRPSEVLAGPITGQPTLFPGFSNANLSFDIQQCENPAFWRLVNRGKGQNTKIGFPFIPGRGDLLFRYLGDASYGRPIYDIKMSFGRPAVGLFPHMDAAEVYWDYRFAEAEVLSPLRMIWPLRRTPTLAVDYQVSVR